MRNRFDRQLEELNANMIQMGNDISKAIERAIDALQTLDVEKAKNAVEADGSVYPCDFYVLDEYKLGNFNTDQLDTIDRKRIEIGFIERSKKL